MKNKSGIHTRLTKVGSGVARGAIAAALAVSIVPAAALAEGTGTVTNWGDLYKGLGVDTSQGYDVVTSATQFTSYHAKDIAASVDKVTEGDTTTGLDGVTVTGAEATVTPKLGTATFDYAATRGDGEFVIQPDTSVENYVWNEYYNSIYAVTVSDGTTTTGALPWVDWYGENATEGYHYNKLEVALNNGTSKGSNKADVQRFAAFYDESDNIKAGTYTVTVYANGYAPLVASGIEVLPTYTGKATASDVLPGASTTTISGLPEDIKDAKVTVSYTVGHGRNAQTTTYAQDVELASDGVVALDASALATTTEGTELSVTVSSSNYAPINTTAKVRTFSDVDYGKWYASGVEFCGSRGIITGYADGRFGVGDPLTRADLATILWRIAEPEEAAAYNAATAENETGMADVQSGTYYTAAANWAVGEGVIAGYDSTDGSRSFGPDDPVTPEQFATIIGRYRAVSAVAEADTSTLDALTDGGSVSSWARQSVAWAKASGLIEGYTNADGTRTLRPQEEISRERAATILMRAYEQGILE